MGFHNSRVKGHINRSILQMMIFGIPCKQFLSLICIHQFWSQGFFLCVFWGPYLTQVRSVLWDRGWYIVYGGFSKIRGPVWQSLQSLQEGSWYIGSILWPPIFGDFHVIYKGHMLGSLKLGPLVSGALASSLQGIQRRDLRLTGLECRALGGART